MSLPYRKILSHFRTGLCRGLQKLLPLWERIILISLSLFLLAGGLWYTQRRMTPEEAAVRSHVVNTAIGYLGANEADGSHQRIVDIYNAHQPRARGYEVSYTDSWCAVFTSAVALESNMTHLIPLECSCEQQILLFDAQGDWHEEDCFLPHPGDLIYYDWNSNGSGDCRGWSDHVGIVVRTFGPVIQVIEGNKNDDVTYRYLFINDPTIRGFGIPNYSGYIS